MLLLLDHYEKVSVHSVVLCCVSLSGDVHLHSGLDTSRYLHLYGLALTHESGSAAAAARIADYLTLSTALLAGRVCNSLSEECVYNSLYLACAVTSRAGLDVRRVLCTLSAAVLARYASFDTDLLFYAFGYLFKCELYSHSDVASSVHLLLALTSTASAKTATEAAKTTESSSEKVVEDVVEVAEATAEVWCRSIYSGVAELVVFRLLVGVAQYGVGFSRLLEPLLGFFIAGILVRMVLDCQFPLCLLYFVCRCVLVHAQHFVIVSFCHWDMFLCEGAFLYSYNHFSESYDLAVEGVSGLNDVEYLALLVFFLNRELCHRLVHVCVERLALRLDHCQALALEI